MSRKGHLKYFKRAIVSVLLLFVSAMGVWVLIQGSETVYRVVLNGDTTIEDHKLYPFRPLTPSSAPHRFRDTPSGDMKNLAVGGLGELDLKSFLAKSDTIALLVIKGNDLIVENYFQGHGKAEISQVFSTSKSILSFLIGAAIEDGVIGSVEDSVTDYIPELAAKDFGNLRIEDVLHMKTNMDYIDSPNPFGQHVRVNYTPDLESEILAFRLKETPDNRFVYKSGDTALLGLVLKRALKGKTITQYTQERLWEPLGMEYGGLWTLDDEGGMEKTWCCLSATARDFAKFGMLYRDRGLWNARRLISEEWIKKSTTEGAYSLKQWQGADYGEGVWNYSYQWWLVDESRGDYITRGKDGQFIYVNPARDVVVVRLGYSLGSRKGHELTTADWITFFQTVADTTSLR